MKNEKKAVLVLYGISLAMALAIFVYLTRVKGYTPEDMTKVALMTLLPILAFYSVGGAIILKHYKGEHLNENLRK